MNDLSTGADAPAADVAAPVATDATVETSEATTGQTTTETVAEQTDTATGDDEAAKPRKKPGVHNRIDELTRQKHEALREANYWRKKAEEAASTNLDDLDYDDQLVAKVRRTERQERAEAAQATVEKVVAQQFHELENAAREKWADYDIVARNPSVRITSEMADIIMDSEMGPDIAYHFGKNPSEAVKLAGLSGIQLAREMGKLEARLSAPKPVPKQPPAPVQPVGGNASGGVLDPNKMSMAEYAAARKAGRI